MRREPEGVREEERGQHRTTVMAFPIGCVIGQSIGNTRRVMMERASISARRWGRSRGEVAG